MTERELLPTPQFLYQSDGSPQSARRIDKKLSKSTVKRLYIIWIGFYWVLQMVGAFFAITCLNYGCWFGILFWVYVLSGSTVGDKFVDEFNNPFVGVNATLKYKYGVRTSLGIFYWGTIPLLLVGFLYSVCFFRRTRRLCPIEGTLPDDPFNSDWNPCAQQCSRTHFVDGDEDDPTDHGGDVYTINYHLSATAIICGCIGMIIGLVLLFVPFGSWEFMYNVDGTEPTHYVVVRYIATGIPYIFCVWPPLLAFEIVLALLSCIYPCLLSVLGIKTAKPSEDELKAAV